MKVSGTAVITDNESVKMTTSKGTIQGYNGVATVDRKHQVIVDGQAFGEGQEHHTLQPVLEATRNRLNHLGIRKDIFKGRYKPIITAGDLCKKITGGAFETIALVSERNLKVISGEKNLICYALTENADKYFCGICGTPIFNQNKRIPGNSMIHIGSLDIPKSISPTINLHCNNMLSWVRDIVALENYEEEIPK